MCSLDLAAPIRKHRHLFSQLLWQASKYSHLSSTQVRISKHPISQVSQVNLLSSDLVITISVILVANSCTYGSTRVLQALAASGKAPRLFAKVDSKGRPIWCVVLQLAFGLLAFISAAPSGSSILSWLLAIAGLSQQFAYLSICIAHIRFRKAWKVRGRPLNDIPWRSPLGVASSYVGLGLLFVSLAATFYSGLFVSRNLDLLSSSSPLVKKNRTATDLGLDIAHRLAAECEVVLPELSCRPRYSGTVHTLEGLHKRS